jgi:putative PIN family toxin of toxin-antitoxin system
MSVVLDTNVLFSGLVYPHSVPGKIVANFLNGDLAVISSQYILSELQRVLSKPKHQLDKETVAVLVETIRNKATLADPMGQEDKDLRDKKDQPVLLTLLSSDAQWLVTGDKDLLALSDRYPIIRPAEFWTLDGSR